MAGGLEPKDMSAKLSAWGQGDQTAGNELIGMVYQELRWLASYYLQSERGDHTLQPTALVHELYLKLFAGEPLQLQDREHFLAVAARQLRHIVVDYARSKHAQKRGGPQGAISLDEAHGLAVPTDSRVIDLDRGLGAPGILGFARRTGGGAEILWRAYRRGSRQDSEDLTGNRQTGLGFRSLLAIEPNEVTERTKCRSASIQSLSRTNRLLADLQAPPSGRQHLAGIQLAIGIEQRLQFPHRLQRFRRELFGHEIVLFHPHAVFPGNRPTSLDAVNQNLLARRARPLHLAGLAGIEKNDGVHVAVAGVENIADRQPVLARRCVDEMERRSDLSARHHAVLHIVSRAHAAHGAECVLAALPQIGRASC